MSLNVTEELSKAMSRINMEVGERRDTSSSASDQSGCSDREPEPSPEEEAAIHQLRDLTGGALTAEYLCFVLRRRFAGDVAVRLLRLHTRSGAQ